jgi:FdhD protein
MHRVRLSPAGGTPAEIKVWPDEDALAAEAPLEIRVEGRPIAVVMRTPGHDEELAAGFLLSEGVISQPEDVFEISICPSQSDGGRAVDVILTRPEAVDFDSLTRHVFTASSCGICGKAVAEAILVKCPPLNPDCDWSIPALTLQSLPERLRSAQPVFAQTGGLHAAALFDQQGQLLCVREDVGRHNAVDKLIGAAWKAGWLPLTQMGLLLSGRVAFELVQKALTARIPVIAAVSAPTSMAVEFASSAGITLCGFVREDRFNVYTHPTRITELNLS